MRPLLWPDCQTLCPQLPCELPWLPISHEAAAFPVFSQAASFQFHLKRHFVISDFLSDFLRANHPSAVRTKNGWEDTTRNFSWGDEEQHAACNRSWMVPSLENIANFGAHFIFIPSVPPPWRSIWEGSLTLHYLGVTTRSALWNSGKSHVHNVFEKKNAWFTVNTCIKSLIPRNTFQKDIYLGETLN